VSATLFASSELTEAQEVQAAALTSQGRVEGLFAVFCEAEDRFFLCADGGESASLAKVVGRFVVADRVSIADETARMAVVHLSPDMATLQTMLCQLSIKPYLVLPAHRLGSQGTDVVIERQALAEFLSRCEEEFGNCLEDDEYFCMRWRAGLPVFPAELNEDVILTECGMHHAVSFAKGCYVGQEVIERSDAIGRLPRTLERIEFLEVRDFALGSVVIKEGGAVGKLLSCGIDREHQRVLAFALCRSGTVKSGDPIQCDPIQCDAMQSGSVPGRIC
jgi:folate-binding protein YgfZ